MRILNVMIVAGAMLAACATETPISVPASDASKADVSGTVKSFSDSVFMNFDFNGDGIITAYEEKEYLKSEFSKQDVDGDGYFDSGCTAAEKARLAESYGPRHPSFAHCDMVDPQGIGRLSKATYFSNRKLHGDQNGDSKITRAEYDAYLEARFVKAAK